MKSLAISNKTIPQGRDKWAAVVDGGTVSIRNVVIPDGGLLKVVGACDSVELFNVYNLANSAPGGFYFALLWPPGDAKTQTAVKRFVWDNSGCTKPILQSTNEAAFRGKADDGRIIGVHFRASKDSHGRPIKQAVQIRHGKQWLLQGGSVLGGWLDLGQQQVAGQGYVTSQRVGTITFDGWNFTTWTPAHKLYEQQPGVDKIVFAGDCRDPDGHKIRNG